MGFATREWDEIVIANIPADFKSRSLNFREWRQQLGQTRSHLRLVLTNWHDVGSYSCMFERARDNEICQHWLAKQETHQEMR